MSRKKRQVGAAAFYDRLAPLFDVMTDWDSRLRVEGPFLFQLLERVKAHSILDAACGSGGHALALANRGFQVVGTDVSPVMIELAQTKGAGITNARFHVAALGDLASRFPPFDVVLCLGNSLPHLLSEDELVRALKDLAGCLRPGGWLVLHNLNYDRRWQVRPRWFAVDSGLYHGGQVLIWRFADYVDGPEPRIHFHIAVFRQVEGNDWSVEVNTTPQRPLFQADLARLLPAAGLTDIAYFGGLTSDPFVPDESPDLVVLARHPA